MKFPETYSLCFFRKGKCEDKYEDAFRTAVGQGNTNVNELKKVVEANIVGDYKYIDDCWKDSSPQATGKQNVAPGLKIYEDNLLSPLLLDQNFKGSKKSERRKKKAIKKAAMQLCYLIQTAYDGRYTGNIKFPG